MYRQLLMFPVSVDRATVECIVTDEMAPFYSQCAGFRSLTFSVGALMGPAARDGGTGVIVEAAFETLEGSLGAIMAPPFEATKTKVESLGAQIYLFEARDV
jgi:hypothetical protein